MEVFSGVSLIGRGVQLADIFVALNPDKINEQHIAQLETAIRQNEKVLAHMRELLEELKKEELQKVNPDQHLQEPHDERSALSGRSSEPDKS